MNKNVKLLLIVLGVVAAVLLAKKFLGQKSDESFASGPPEVASEPAKEEPVEASGSNADYKSLDNNDGLVGDAAPADCFPLINSPHKNYYHLTPTINGLK